MVYESGLKIVQRNTDAPACEVHRMLLNLHPKQNAERKVQT